MKSLLSVLLSVVLISCTAMPAFADNDRDCQPVAGFWDPSDLQANDDYVNLVDNTVSTTDAAEDLFTISRDMYAYALRVDINVAPGTTGGTDKRVYTVMDDGAATLLTCTMSGTATTCSSTWNYRATIAAGSDLTVKQSSATGASAPDAASEARFSFCLSRKR